MKEEELKNESDDVFVIEGYNNKQRSRMKDKLHSVSGNGKGNSGSKPMSNHLTTKSLSKAQQSSFYKQR